MLTKTVKYTDYNGNERTEKRGNPLDKTIQEIVIDDKNNQNPVSIGVISPFRAQVDLIKNAILQVFDTDTIAKHNIDVGTAHTFQGDERDIMLLSWTFAQNSKPQSLIFAQKPNLFNVAITRARKKLINFILYFGGN